MKCKNCKSKIKPTQKFCPKCGKEIKPKKIIIEKTQALIACVCCVVLIASGTIGGLYFYKSNNTIDDSDSNYISLEAGFTDVKVTDEKSALEAISSVADVIGINNVREELFIDRIDTVEEINYYRFNQLCNSVPVDGKFTIIAADKDGNALALTSNYVNTKTHSIHINNNLAQNEVNANIQKAIGKSIVTAEKLDTQKIVYIQNNNEFIYAYKLLASTESELYMVYINAEDGAVIKYANSFDYTSAEVVSEDGLLKTTGWKNDDGSYHLYNDEHKISIFDFSQFTESKQTEWNYKKLGIDTMYSKTNIFNEKGVKLLSYLCQFDDYFIQLGDKGFDRIHAAINDSIGTNASADGAYLLEDDKLIRTGAIFVGENRNIDDIDIIAHEYTHMVSKSINRWDGKEPSALNEGISDIFGEIIESSIKGNCDWKHDERNLADPENKNNRQRYPASIDYLDNSKMYKEKYYINKNQVEDYSHYASTIISHSAYLMNVGINQNNAKQIDMNLLGKLWYKSIYLMQSSCSFSQCCNAVELSARIMLKNGELTQEQYNCVCEAFNAVGIDNAPCSYKYRVKNNFDLRVLNIQNTDDVNFNLKVYKIPENNIDINIFFKKNDKPKIVLEENSLYGNKQINLDDGVYYLSITDLDENAQNSVPIVTKIIVDGDDENAVEEVVVHTDFSDITTVLLNDESLLSNDLVYKEYAKIINNLVNKYGKTRVKSDTYFILGLCYAELIDLNNDGIDELYVIYSQETDDYAPKYTYEVYGYQDSKIDKLNSGEPYSTDGGVKHAIIGENNNQKYIVTGASDDFSFEYYYGFNINNTFELIKSFECEDFSEGIYKINGKEVSESEWYKESEKWGKNSKWSALYEDNIDELINSINIVLEKLGIERFSNDNQYTNDNNRDISDNTQFYGNKTAEQLRKSIIGSWGALGSIAPEYNFIDSENCTGENPWQSSGNYSISDNKTLTVSWSGKSESEIYIWSSESWDEFYSHHKHDVNFWYMTDDGTLMLNGKEKYRDGVDNFIYNSNGDLMAIISGIWISDKGYKEYQINSDGTWIESTVVISGGTLINRTKLDNGKVEIIDDTTAKLWQEVEHLNQMPGASELIYDSKNDKISVGSTNNTFKRAKYE